MSTRIHWAGEDGHRSCTHGRTATHREVSEAEFLRLPNLCRTCERVAQKSQALSVLQAFGAGKPKSLPASQWPEPRPIAEAPTDEAFLGYVPMRHGSPMEPGWYRMTACTDEKDYITDWVILGARPAADRFYSVRILHPTHFLPLPPKPEVRK